MAKNRSASQVRKRRLRELQRRLAWLDARLGENDGNNRLRGERSALAWILEREAALAAHEATEAEVSS